MKKEKSLVTRRILKIIKWVFLVLIGLYIILIICRAFYLNGQEKTSAQVEKIHATKLALDDVLGKNLPPDPGTLADQTVPGIDANNNGIRDDVELAIFNTYPNSAKTRAVLLQYALALQMETVQPFVNTQIATEVAREEDRAYQCVGEVLIRDDNNKKIMDQYFADGDKLRSFVENIQINTEERKKAQENFLNQVRSYSSLERICDIDYSKLPN